MSARTINPRLAEELSRLLADRFESAAPGTGLFGTVFPQDEDEVLRIMAAARDSNVAIVPRAAGSSPYGGAMPHGGLVIRFDRLNRLLAVDRQRHIASVQPGIVWDALIQQLAPLGLMPRVYPSSRGVSTVGGFVAQGGVGIGSYQFGDIGQTVTAVRIIDASGESRVLTKDADDLVVGAEGRTGIIVEVSLRLQPSSQMAGLVALFRTVEAMEGAVADLASRQLPLWTVSIMDRVAVGLASNNRSSFALPQGCHAALFCFRERDSQKLVPYLRGSVLAAGGKLWLLADDSDEWLQQFMSLQSLGSTPVPMQHQLPPRMLTRLLVSLPPDVRNSLAFEAVVGQAGSAVATRFFLAGPSAAPDGNFPMARLLLSAVREVGGRSYATGALFLEEAESVYGSERLGRMEAFRAIVDPDDRLNPGKAFLAGPRPG